MSPRIARTRSFLSEQFGKQARMSLLDKLLVAPRTVSFEPLSGACAVIHMYQRLELFIYLDGAAYKRNEQGLTVSRSNAPVCTQNGKTPRRACGQTPPASWTADTQAVGCLQLPSCRSRCSLADSPHLHRGTSSTGFGRTRQVRGTIE